MISTNTLLAEGDVVHRVPVDTLMISTNTLLAEGDFSVVADLTQRLISTNTLLAEGDHDIQAEFPAEKKFQPTPSSRRVTAGSNTMRTKKSRFQPTPSSRRVTSRRLPEGVVRGISTNTLLAEGDPGTRPHV